MNEKNKFEEEIKELTHAEAFEAMKQALRDLSDTDPLKGKIIRMALHNKDWGALT